MRRTRLALILALAVFALPALAAPKGKAAGKHPKVESDPAVDTCVSCHADATPEVAKDWDQGPHGLALVQCVVCHGSTGKDFAPAPAPERCQGCHPVEADSISRPPGPRAAARGKRAQRCADCHAPHTLAVADGKASPHTR
jgi:cytochrome c553